MDIKHAFDVSIVTPQGIVFEGKAQHVIFPGESGAFEVLVNHKPLLSRLLSGKVLVDELSIPIERGVVKVAMNQVVAIVEQ
ncbi:MAG: hypothetical protein HYS55_01660 [Candidatus Omnitrophica bacterium]|nr:hypothetical protein [Candidatus Omnitrophota bacterium]